ncbi:CMT1A duplicated region transcript 1 protein [Pimephales promelas]|uniref:CMT1A duplicated region transcript 1 protein n=1 Tax=Pimephales promelas TaxID=90988 RepID=UPI0019559BC7|nr:CMT1A duplicated region transcript 1 protein [Pimephales promelas]KAG1955203.1 F-box/WD repeat-containing protein [Pimephales promelas]KAG1955205.1 F-box/WD repeat-containing protein [Pimephales promelas]
MTEVKCLRREAGDSVLEWSCKKNGEDFNICGRCQTCVLSQKLHHYTQWVIKTGGASQRRFLTGILVRCHNLQILEHLQSVLQVTSGKDFTYSRSRALPSKPEDTIWRMDGAMDTKLHEMGMLETWEWFRESPDSTKSKYVLGLLSLCDTPLLHMLANLVHILIVWEKHKFLQFSNADLSVTESRISCHSDDHPDLDLLIKACTSHEPADLPREAHQGSETDVLRPKHSELIKDAKSLKSISHEVELDMHLDPWNKRKERDDSDNSDDPDPALTVVPRSSKSLSGVSRHKDFIRRLPVDIAKIILGLLDKASLDNCKCVSKHWQWLTDEILTEVEVKKNVEKQAMILQGNSTSKVNPVYAKICEVLVPISEGHKQFQHEESFPKHRLTQEQDLDSIYKGFITKTVQIEERNVYCGVYNILVLLERDDPSRVIHYAGGQFVAVGSRDRTIRFLHVASPKEVPLVIQGHAGSVRAVLVCEERDLVISASYDLSIRCWNLKTGVCTMIFHGHFGTVNCLDLYGDRLVSGAKDCRIKVWNLLTGKCVENLKFKHLKPITCVKSNETLVVSSCAGGQIRVWCMETASLIRQISGHQGAVLCLCFDQWHILSGGSDGEVKAWSTNCSFKKCLRTFQHPKEVLTMSFLFLRLITGCMDGKIRIFNFLNGDCLRVIRTNIKQFPVLSLHTHHNTVVVNTRGGILMLQFADVHWDYSASPFFKRCQISFENVPRTAEQTTQGGSPSPKSRFHRFKSLSTPSMQHARDAQQESTRVATWNQLQAHRHSRTSINMQSECLSRPRSVLSASRPVSGYKDFQNRVSRTPNTASTNLDKKTYGTKHSVLDQSEKAALDRVRKRGPHHPVTPDLVLLRASSSQKSLCSDKARSNMELNARVRDAWGPDLSRETSFQTTTKRMSEIHAPFTTHSVDLNPQGSSMSRQTCLTPHSLPKQSQRSFKVIRSGTNKVDPLNMASPEDGKTPQRVFMRRTSMPTNCHEDFKMTKKSSLYHVPLDPFRKHGVFQLRTDTQLDAFIQECTRQQQSHKHDRGGQSKSVSKHSHCHQ